MIVGIGIDICIIKRIEKTLDKYGERFKKRCFTSEEIVKCDKRYSSAACYAKRFAAKEAFSKALGTGIAKGINFNEIIVLNEKNGKPFIRLLGKTKVNVEKKIKKKKYKISLSLTDEDNYAVAFVTISI